MNHAPVPFGRGKNKNNFFSPGVFFTRWKLHFVF